MSSVPHISVIMPTCNRPRDVERALASLVHVQYPSWDVLVVDQSDDLHTREIVQRYAASLPQLIYRHLQSKNCSRARNVGIEASGGEILVFLDDDCTVRPDWLTQIVAVFDRHPQAAHGFAAVLPPEGVPSWSAEGWTPTYPAWQEIEVKVKGDIRAQLRLPYLLGMGACMFVRREVTKRVDRFDVHLGGGGRFPSHEDGDYSYRAFRAGFNFVHAPGVVVVHHGTRDYESGAASRLLRAYILGRGAWIMKAVRLRDPFAVLWLLDFLLRFSDPRSFFAGRGPKDPVRLVEFVHGLLASFQLRVDRQSGLYLARTTHS
jgi:GT2 family glycosyltransferase